MKDGSCLLKESRGTGWQVMTAEDARALKDFIDEKRAAEKPHDILKPRHLYQIHKDKY